jgi:sulfate permease, SulP family
MDGRRKMNTAEEPRMDARTAPADAAAGMPSALRGDVCGGLVAGVVAVACAIAYAQAAAAPLGAAWLSAAAATGLVATVVGGAVAARFAQGPAQTCTPRGAVMVVVASVAQMLLQHFGTDAMPQVLGWLMSCLVMAALLQCTFGLLRLGAFVSVIPSPVISGLSLGIGAQLVICSVPVALGLSLSGFDAPSALAAAAAGAAIACAPRWGQRAPALPLGLVAGVLAYHLATLFLPEQPGARLQPLDTTGTLTSMPLMLEAVTGGTDAGFLGKLLAASFSIALINSIEALASGAQIAAFTNHRCDGDRLLLQSGVASLCSTCLGGVPVAASVPAAMAGLAAGGRSMRANWVAVATAAVLGLLALRWIDVMPVSVMAALMMIIGMHLLRAAADDAHTHWDLSARSWQTPVHGAVISALVCAGVLCFGVMPAVAAGVIACGAGLGLHARRAPVKRRYRAADLGPRLRSERPDLQQIGHAIEIVEPRHPLFFANVDKLIGQIDPPPGGVEVTIVDMSRVGAPDVSALRSLLHCANRLEKQGCRLLLVHDHAGDCDEPTPTCASLPSLPRALDLAWITLAPQACARILPLHAPSGAIDAGQAAPPPVHCASTRS